MYIHEEHSQVWIDNVQAYIDELGTYQREKKLEVPLFFIRFLYVMLCSCRIPTAQALLYGVATTLLKMGLDTHIQDRHKPMDVLAGDYLSIQFYCLLSAQGEVEGIGHVAKTISKLNEWNMEHHIWLQQGVPYDDSALQRVQRISGALILSVVNYFSEQIGVDIHHWNRIIPCAFLLNEVHSGRYPLTSSAGEFMHRTEVELQEMISHLASIRLQEELYHLLENHQIFSLKEGYQHEQAVCTR